MNIEELIGKMTVEQKISLLGKIEGIKTGEVTTHGRVLPPHARNRFKAHDSGPASRSRAA